MATTFSEDELQPISIPEAIESVQRLIGEIVRKNKTLVDYYIHPKPTPTEIEGYHPRLQVLYSRCEILAALEIPKLTILVDDAAALVSAFLLPVIDQLLNAVHGVQQIFINHYDRKLEYREPYSAVYDALECRERQLKKFQGDQMRNPQRRLPESLTPAAPSAAEQSFCRFAVAFTNHRDHGKLAHVHPEELFKEEREKLLNSDGAYLSWDCPGCAFKLRYHVANSLAANILATDDVRSHTSVPEVEYRPSFLVKCHLYQRKSEDTDDNFTQHSRRTSDTTFGNDSRRSTTWEIPKRSSTIRRQSDARNPRVSNSFFFGGAKKTKLGLTERYVPVRAKSSTSTSKYGCPFCFVVGKEYGHMDYEHGRDLAEHIAAKHHVGRAPSALMLEKYMVGLDGRCAENVRRWDLNIKSK
ncbi:hypothetical protein LTR05_007491 [Lithohypha guttulata]|uniref:Uncharacterized protein n=1 Tax=Lithohypha guttulata TaxID=1690604 RepID=A0AAN7Y959_9EURO|nr:hypothetical protein LTR05_007491 [Lithohypha guttulata]